MRGMILERIDVMSFAKLNAIFGLVVGLAMGVLTLIFTSLLSDFIRSPSIDAALATQQTIAQGPQLIVQLQQLGFFGVIFFLIGGVITGFIVGAVMAFVYNLSAKLVGGVKIELEEP
ncbi:MAG: DUF3566 domain-containing protein [Candidatus Iainarchaeum archaeon]|uniref:DUF3566 domain-containing protein n=1 Tax=Candidatus Iainarchaeum sp. TaxID=3101447 RepID=A0A7T9DIU1_9ARCH|nr:MAG: DUF3566 domain-containing protein [Candidatus Diapherotrites archaeon]